MKQNKGIFTFDEFMNFQYFNYDKKTNQFLKNKSNEKKKKILSKQHKQRISKIEYYSCDEKERIYFPLMFNGKDCFFICVDAPNASVLWKLKIEIPSIATSINCESKLISHIWTVLFYSKICNKIVIIDTDVPNILVEKEIFPPKEAFSKSKKLPKEKLVGFGSENLQNYAEENRFCSIF